MAPDDFGDFRLPPLRPIPIDALFDSTGTRPNRERPLHPVLAAVDVIVAQDVMTRERYLVYGKDAFERVVATDRPAQLSFAVVTLDYQTDELERLCSLVEVLRGRHDFKFAD